MTTPSPDDELLLILLRNLQNAASTFGQGTPPYNDVLSTVNEHLQDMKRKGATTNLAKARELMGLDASPRDAAEANPFGSLAFRPKPR